MEKRDKIKRLLGVIWMLLGPAAILALIVSAIQNIDAKQKGDIHQPLPWIIIIAVFIPIAIGLTIFGWYAYRGEYDQET